MSPRPIGRDAFALLEDIALRVEAGRRLEAGAGEAVLRSVVEATVALFEAEAASIALYDPVANRLVFRVAAGPQGQGVVGVAIPPDQGLAGYVFTTGQAIALSDVERDPRFGRRTAEQTGYVPRSIVAVPLVDERGTIGVLEVLDKRDAASFSLRDTELAAVFARQAAVAISATHLERETAALLAGALAMLAADRASDSDDALPAADPKRQIAIERIVAAASANLASDDATTWALADLLARVRRADPEQLALVVDVIEVLARHTERGARTRRARRA